MTIEEVIERYSHNAEYEHTHGNLQGCLEFRQLVDWLKDYKRLKEQESKQAHWVYDDDCHEHGYCSECGTKEDLVDGKIRYFCRVCGAKMREVEE